MAAGCRANRDTYQTGAIYESVSESGDAIICAKNGGIFEMRGTAIQKLEKGKLELQFRILQKYRALHRILAV